MVQPIRERNNQSITIKYDIKCKEKKKKQL